MITMFFASILSGASGVEQAESTETLAGGIPLKIAGVSKTFNGRAGLIDALRPVNIDVTAGEFVCLLGPSGCGKSTLLSAIAGFSLASSGSITVSGQPIAEPGPER